MEVLRGIQPQNPVHSSTFCGLSSKLLVYDVRTLRSDPPSDSFLMPLSPMFRSVRSASTFCVTLDRLLRSLPVSLAWMGPRPCSLANVYSSSVSGWVFQGASLYGGRYVLLVLSSWTSLPPRVSTQHVSTIGPKVLAVVIISEMRISIHLSLLAIA